MPYVANIRSFTVYMKPQGKARPRVTRRGAYTPKATVAASNLIAGKYRDLYGEKKPFSGAVHLYIYAYDALPQSQPKRVTEAPYAVKPDADNVAKLVMDALNKLAYNDDAQIVQLHVIKKERRRNEVPRIEVYVSEFNEAH